MPDHFDRLGDPDRQLLATSDRLITDLKRRTTSQHKRVHQQELSREGGTTPGQVRASVAALKEVQEALIANKFAC
jgi:hypothetical protein